MAETLFQPTLVSDFDCGNGRLVGHHDDGRIDIEMQPDAGATWHQWFYFRLDGCAGQSCQIRLLNAGKAAFARGYEGYQALAREQGGNWQRVATDYADGVLTIRKQVTAKACEFAYFVPFTSADHAALLAAAVSSPLVRHEVAGQTLDGRALDLLHVTKHDPGPKFQIWLIARQHPGEAMAEWWMAGLLRRLLAADPGDTAVAELLRLADFHIVPNMNPDGSARGHIRGNAAGEDLNRAWNEPSAETSPEVYWVRAAMAESGVDFCLDVHGDEALPYVFLNGMAGVPCLNDGLRDLNERIYQAYLAASPDFQIGKGYPPAKPGTANLAICANYVAETHKCLALTLEQPFKDNANAPDPEHGWSPARSKALGAAFLDALAVIAPDLR